LKPIKPIMSALNNDKLEVGVRQLIKVVAIN